MFKTGKAKNLIARLNNMSKKEAYTWGAIILVCLVALLMVGNLFGNASDDASFDGLSSRGYDLAQMPFLDDEAEKYLLSSKYSDMNGNQVDGLYTAQQKKERQEQDAAQNEEDALSGALESGAAVSGNSYGGGASSSSGRRGGYRGGGGGTRTPTAIGQLGSKSGGTSGGGSGLNATWGNPTGDFSPYNKTQNKGDETPLSSLKNKDARRALSQFAQTSRAAAGLKDAKGLNAKRALMGGNIKNSEAFTDSGIQLSSGLTTDDLDTNAPASSADLSNLDDALTDANDAGEGEYQESDEKSFWQMFAEKLVETALEIGKQWLSGYLSSSQATKKQTELWRNAADVEHGITKDGYAAYKAGLKKGETAESWTVWREKGRKSPEWQSSFRAHAGKKE